MNISGQIQDGAVVPDQPLSLPNGTRVTIVVAEDEGQKKHRQGGWMKGQIHIAEDFDELPDDIARAFGMEPE